jgi:hypothetical protein
MTLFRLRDVYPMHSYILQTYLESITDSIDPLCNIYQLSRIDLPSESGRYRLNVISRVVSPHPRK